MPIPESCGGYSLVSDIDRGIVGSMGDQTWETPEDVFELIQSQFSIFTLDCAASGLNTKCYKHYTEAQNAFLQSPVNETIWANPPYANLDPWIELFARWSLDNEIVALLPAKTDTRWFRRCFETADEIYFLEGRINFVNSPTGNNAGSIIVHWREAAIHGPAEFFHWQWRK